VLIALSSFLDTLLTSGFGCVTTCMFQCNEKALVHVACVCCRELVYSVKEGWRREDPMKGAEEMMYFSMVTACLHYQR
jgi:hypothetical protein